MSHHDHHAHDHHDHHHHSPLDELNHHHGTEIVLQGELDANIEKVWEILTDNNLLKQWFPELRFTDLKSGGTLHFEAEEMDLSFDMMVYDVEPPVLLSFEWGKGDIVTFELQAIDESTTQINYSQWIHHIDLDHHAKDVTGWLICMQKIAAMVDDKEMPETIELFNEYYDSVKELVQDQSQKEFN
ncbi:SRPBCC domain-containing protein [Aerococcaceae bacterium WGS1372]